MLDATCGFHVSEQFTASVLECMGSYSTIESQLYGIQAVTPWYLHGLKYTDFSSNPARTARPFCRPLPSLPPTLFINGNPHSPSHPTDP